MIFNIFFTFPEFFILHLKIINNNKLKFHQNFKQTRQRTIKMYATFVEKFFIALAISIYTKKYNQMLLITLLIKKTIDHIYFRIDSKQGTCVKN